LEKCNKKFNPRKKGLRESEFVCVRERWSEREEREQWKERRRGGKKETDRQTEINRKRERNIYRCVCVCL
jgi:hypothetical protein